MQAAGGVRDGAELDADGRAPMAILNQNLNRSSKERWLAALFCAWTGVRSDGPAGRSISP